MTDLSKHRLELDYPCKWCYKIVIKDEHNGNKIAKEVFDTKEHTIRKSKTSSKGKFKSYSIDTIVDNEEQRKDLHKKLTQHKHIKMVV